MEVVVIDRSREDGYTEGGEEEGEEEAGEDPNPILLQYEGMKMSRCKQHKGAPDFIPDHGENFLA